MWWQYGAVKTVVRWWTGGSNAVMVTVCSQCGDAPGYLQPERHRVHVSHIDSALVVEQDGVRAPAGLDAQVHLFVLEITGIC